MFRTTVLLCLALWFVSVSRADEASKAEPAAAAATYKAFLKEQGADKERVEPAPARMVHLSSGGTSRWAFPDSVWISGE